MGCMSDPTPTDDPGRTPRLVATWIVIALAAATAAHLLFLPEKESADEEATSSESSTSMAPIGDGPIRLVQYAPDDELNENPIDGDRAFGYLEAVCRLGPRPSGSRAMIAQQKMATEHFESLGAVVERQAFRA